MQLIREYGTTVAILIVGAIAIAWILNPAPHPLEGAMAPDFTLPRASGDTVTLSQHLAKDVVVLDFWASWCPPCRKGLPMLDAVAKHFADQSVAVYGINIRESPALVASFVKTTNLGLPILLDDTGIVADDYMVTGIPQTVIIDKTGRIQKIHTGVGFGFEGELQTEIQALLDGITKPE